jgi:hypothetical protein
MKLSLRTLFVSLLGATALVVGNPARADEFSEARIYIEYNESANDLGFHVSLDGEDWTRLQIYDPNGTKIADLTAKGGYKDLGLTELFFEGAEPNLGEFPLEELLALFPEGEYTFIGKTADGGQLVSTATLTHDVPAGPSPLSTAASPACNGDTIAISWPLVTGPAAILPEGDIDVVGYQVIVESFQVTLPGTSSSVTVPEEFYQSLTPGIHDFEVLAIDASGNQTITEGTFVKP